MDRYAACAWALCPELDITSHKNLSKRCLVYLCVNLQCPRHNACAKMGVSSANVCAYLLRDDVHASVADWL